MATALPSFGTAFPEKGKLFANIQKYFQPLLEYEANNAVLEKQLTTEEPNTVKMIEKPLFLKCLECNRQYKKKDHLDRHFKLKHLKTENENKATPISC